MKTLLKKFLALSCAPIALASYTTVLATTAPSTPAADSQVKLSYSVVWNGSNLGQVETTIKQQDATFEVASITKAEGMASIWLGGDLIQSCQFETRDNMIYSSQFVSKKEGKNSYANIIKYDWPNQKITFNEEPAFDMPSGYILDNCNFHFAAAYTAQEKLRNNTIYVLDGKKKRIRGYIFKSSSEEKLITPVGDFATTKIVLQRELDPAKTFTFWISNEKPYFPLKMMDQRKSGKRILLIQRMDLG